MTGIIAFFLLQIGKKGSLPAIPRCLLYLIALFVSTGIFIVHDFDRWAQFRYIFLIIFLLLSIKDIGWSDWFFRLAFIAAVFYIMTTIWLYFDTSTYYSVFANAMYPYETRFAIFEGTAGVTDHYSTNGMMLANAAIVVFSFLMANIHEKKKRGKYAFLLLLCVIAIFLTGKRAHLLFVGISLLATLYLYYADSKGRFTKYLLVIIVLLLFLCLGYCFIPQVSALFERFSSDETMLGRYQFWNAALNEYRSHKLFGIGWFGFRNKVAPTVFYTGHAHNIYVQMLCELGLVGTSVFLCWFLYSLAKAFSAIKQLSYKKTVIGMDLQGLLRLKLFSVFGLSYQIYFLLYGMTGNPLYDIYQYPYYFIASILPIYVCSVLSNRHELR